MLTIAAAARQARPGDVVLVRTGVYREEVVIPWGGQDEDSRITFAAEPGGEVVVTGSDVFATWTPLGGDMWQLRIPNPYFGGFNPYAEQVFGDWFSGGRVHRRGMVYLRGSWLPEKPTRGGVFASSGPAWFSWVDGLVDGSAPSYTPTFDRDGWTTITAKLPGIDPNRGEVEVGVRETVFKPAATNIDFVTIRGFRLRHAATNWAAPSSGQWGLVSAYWCRRWVIEDNEIAYSRCAGIALGKYADEFDGLRGTTEGYYETVADARATGGWSFDNIGCHIIRNNVIHHCGQVGIVGSLGAIGSEITGNEIYQINTQEIWFGQEAAGIKLHAAVDVVIAGNHIYDTGEYAGIWLDWMAQGTQVRGNLMHGHIRDLLLEVDHGPILIADNILLSPTALWSASDGVAFAHNIVGGAIEASADRRETHCLVPHSTDTAALVAIPLGAHQWVNNILGPLTDASVWDAASAASPNVMRGNVITRGATPSVVEEGGADAATVHYSPVLTKASDGWYLSVPRDEGWRDGRAPVTTSSLANAPTPDQPFTDPDGSPLDLSVDFLGVARSSVPFPGPFELAGGDESVRVWSRIVPTVDAWGRVDVRATSTCDPEPR